MSASTLLIKYAENKTPYIEYGTYTIRLESEKPDVETMRIAVEELRETPDIVQPAIEELRALLKGKVLLVIFDGGCVMGFEPSCNDDNGVNLVYILDCATILRSPCDFFSL